MIGMRERIAHIIWERNLPADFRISWEDEDKEYWLADADAILSELETPTDGMINASYGNFSNYVESEFMDAWSAAIRAAKEGK
jgi:hypothetical protein